jgi:putative aldouronate transport system permease protein
MKAPASATPSSLERIPMHRSRFQIGLARFKREKYHQGMAWLGIVYLVIFAYLPMFGIVMAFQKFDFTRGFIRSPFVGLVNFAELFSDAVFWKALRNTLLLSLSKLGFAFLAPIVFALLLNETKSLRFKKIVQTVSYLPHFISWVVVAAFLTMWLGTSYDSVVNTVLVRVGVLKEPIAFLTYPTSFVIIAVFSEVWKSTGFSAIIYLSAIAGIDVELYEAAVIDGANRFQMMVTITVPMMKRTIIVLLILACGSLFTGGPGGSNFSQAYLLGNSLNAPVSDILDTYILRLGLQLGRYSFAAAAGLALSIVSFITVGLANWVVAKLGEESIF